VSRRQLLTVAGVTLGSAVVDLAATATPAAAAPTAAAATSAGLTVTALADDPVTVLSAGAAPAVATVPRQLAVQVRNSQAELPAGSRLTFTYDPRLYAPVEPAGVSLAGRPLAVSSTTTLDAGSGAAICTVTVHEAVPARAATDAPLTAVVGTARPVRYPRDLVHRSVPASTEVPATHRTPHVRHDLPARPGPAARSPAARSAAARTAGTPWGIALGGGWFPRRWGAAGEFLYHWPAQVTLTSVGPGAAPVPAAFTLAVDPRIVRELTVDGMRLNGRPVQLGIRRTAETRTADVYETRWLTRSRLKAGDVLDVLFSAETLDPGGPLPTIKHPVVSLSGLGDHPSRRDTGQNTISRTDAIHEP
jgi:hypothetical protein